MKLLLQEVLDYLERREAESPQNICSACGHLRKEHIKDSAGHDVCVQGLGTDYECSCIEFKWEATHIGAILKDGNVSGSERERFILADKVRTAILALEQTVSTGTSTNVFCEVNPPPSWNAEQ